MPYIPCGHYLHSLLNYQNTLNHNNYQNTLLKITILTSYNQHMVNTTQP